MCTMINTGQLVLMSVCKKMLFHPHPPSKCKSQLINVLNNTNINTDQKMNHFPFRVCIIIHSTDTKKSLYFYTNL